MASSVHNWIWLQCTTNSSPENRFGPEKLLVDPEESLAYLMKCFHCHGTLTVHILLQQVTLTLSSNCTPAQVVKFPKFH